MPILETFQKQPADVQDYDIDFTKWLRGFADTGLSVFVAVEPGITLNSQEFANGVVKGRAGQGSGNPHPGERRL